MEKKINVAELLKDCPKGMELDCTIWDNDVKVLLDKVLDDGFGYPIKVIVKYNNIEYYKTFTEYGAFDDLPYSKCVIFPKGKTTWEGFQKPFKDGDIIFTHADCLRVGVGNTWISIFQENRNGGVATYIDYAEDGSDYYDYIDGDKALLCMNKDILRQRLATEEEKQKLFDAIKKNGYKWNEETKTLEKLIEPKFKVGDVIQDVDKYKVKITEVNLEDKVYGYKSLIAKGVGGIAFTEQGDWELVPNKFDITTLKTFESRVLVRDDMFNEWYPAIWGFYNAGEKYSYVIVSGNGYEMCIPYEGNEHLLGTTDDCDDYYKTWEK